MNDPYKQGAVLSSESRLKDIHKSLKEIKKALHSDDEKIKVAFLAIALIHMYINSRLPQELSHHILDMIDEQKQ